MRVGIVLCVAAFVAGCSESKAKDAVKELLIDPESAQFSNVESKNGVTCGFVNSRNRMGGYVGKTPFMVENGTARLASDADVEFGTEFGTKCPEEVVKAFIRRSIPGVDI